MGSADTGPDLSGTGYDISRLRAELPPGWSAITVVADTDSTNADLLADPDGPTGQVLVADHQRAGRGRLGRRWEAAPGTALMLSVRIRPRLPRPAWGWIPLVAGLGVRAAILSSSASGGSAAGSDAQVVLKWPNDVMGGAAERKVAGILVQADAGAAVIGIGCNVSGSDTHLEQATSLAALGHRVERSDLLLAVLAEIGWRLRALQAAAGDAEAAGSAAEYRQACTTLGRRVRVTLGATVVEGYALDVDSAAALVVRSGSSERAVAAGDVTHLRPSEPAG